jgi:hypothetical protein
VTPQSGRRQAPLLADCVEKLLCAGACGVVSVGHGLGQQFARGTVDRVTSFDSRGMDAPYRLGLLDRVFEAS